MEDRACDEHTRQSDGNADAPFAIPLIYQHPEAELVDQVFDWQS
jgi:hypothetical protein